jgi:phage-related protein
MYNIEFYEDANGHSELWDFLEELRLKAATNKDAPAKADQFVYSVSRRQRHPTKWKYNQTSGWWHLGITSWQYLYFYFKDDTFVLLHQFRKKTQKTPKREIERAKAERDDYLRRKEADWLWEPGMITKNMLNLLIPK